MLRRLAPFAAFLTGILLSCVPAAAQSFGIGPRFSFVRGNSSADTPAIGVPPLGATSAEEDTAGTKAASGAAKSSTEATAWVTWGRGGSARLMAPLTSTCRAPATARAIHGTNWIQ